MPKQPELTLEQAVKEIVKQSRSIALKAATCYVRAVKLPGCAGKAKLAKKLGLASLQVQQVALVLAAPRVIPRRSQAAVREIYRLNASTLEALADTKEVLGQLLA